MVKNIGALNPSDNNDKKVITNPASQTTQDNTTDVVPMVEDNGNDNEGIPVDSFEYRVKKIILKKGFDKNNDDFIQEDEYRDICDYFDVNDIKKLLAKTNDSSAQSKPQENEIDEVDAAEFKKLSDSSNAVLKNDDSAAYALNNNIAGDLVMTTASGTTFSAQMNNLLEKRKEILNKHQDSSAIDAEIDALKESVQEYIKNNQVDVTQDLIENGSVKPFKYGKNLEKTGYIFQTVDLKGGNTKSKDDETENTEDGEQGNTSQTGVNIKYGLQILTENLHAVANAETGENTDLQAAVVYNKNLKNNGKLSISGNFRQTIDKENNQTSGGASADCSWEKMSTGAYLSYSSEEADSEKYKTLTFEGYAKYKNSLRFAVGHEQMTTNGTDINYNYLSTKLSGSKELTNNSISLSGSVEGRYGITKMSAEESGENLTLPDYKLMAKGGFTFKSTNLKTNVFANVSLEGGKVPFDGGYDNNLSATLVGNVSTPKVDFTATLTGVNTTEYDIDANNQLYSSKTKKLAASITYTPKALFALLGNKSNVVPSFTYSISNDKSSKQYLGMSVSANF